MKDASAVSVVDFDHLFSESRPLIDVRAPIEFAKGVIPSAVNLPILNDDERSAVGIMYKQEGPLAATELGRQLTSGQIRQERTAAWIQFLQQHPEAILFCFRGGQRSKIACEWLEDAGYSVPRIAGGYKSMRTWLLDGLETWPCRASAIVVGGKTGTGKTDLFRDHLQFIDLEGLAQHRGSAFGKRPGGQPAQASFENSLSIAFLQHRFRQQDRVILEDESKLIGRLRIPEAVLRVMKRSKMIVVEDSIDNRVERIFAEYIVQQWHQYEDHFADQAYPAFCDYLTSAMANISKRLGGVRYKTLSDLLGTALRAQERGDYSMHKVWIKTLLCDYYDPMYDYQLQDKATRIVFTGTPAAVTDWIGHSGQDKP